MSAASNRRSEPDVRFCEFCGHAVGNCPTACPNRNVDVIRRALHPTWEVQANIALSRLITERDTYQQALSQIAKWPATGKAQELAKIALDFTNASDEYWDDVRKTARTFGP